MFLMMKFPNGLQTLPAGIRKQLVLIGLIVHIVARDGPDGVLNVRVIIRHLTDAQLLSASRRVRASVTARR